MQSQALGSALNHLGVLDFRPLYFLSKRKFVLRASLIAICDSWLLMTKECLIVKKIIKFFKLLKRRIDIYNAESELKFILENK